MKPSAPHLEVLWYDGSLVGHLVNRGTIYFLYEEQWVESGRNLSPISLPFTTAAFNGAKGIEGVPGLIFDCVPDDWGRKVAARDFKQLNLGSPSTMDLLAWRGMRGIGALQFRPAMIPGDKAACPRMEAVALAALARGALAIERGEATQVLAQLKRGGTAGGAYPKALVLSYPDGTFGVGDPDGVAVPYMVKFEMPGRAGASQCEHAYSLMAGQAGIRSVETRLAPDGEKRHLMIKRFDIAEGGDSKKRHHCHSASGLLQKHPREVDYADVFRAILKIGLPREELNEWSRRTVFNVLAANADDHGKNHGFSYDENDGWRLSPAYDMNFAESMVDRGMTVAGEVWPSEATMKNLFKDAGLTTDESQRVFDQVDEAIDKWPNIAKDCGVPKAMAGNVRDHLARIRKNVFPAKVAADRSAVEILPLPLTPRKKTGHTLSR